MTHLSTTVEIAAALRTRAGLTKAPYSTTRIIRTCFPDVVVTGRKLPPLVDEIVTRTADGPLIVYKRGLSSGEQRLAIAHGLAHLLFDDATDAAGVGRVGTPSCEERADRFGAELLVPLSDLSRVVRLWPAHARAGSAREEFLDHVDQIAALFNVTAPLIHERIRRLERLADMHGEIVLTE